MSKIDEALDKIEDIVNDVKEYAKQKAEKVDPETKEKIQALVDKTTKVVEETKDKIVNVAKNVQDDEKVNEFLQKITVKVQEVADFTKMKVSELIPEREKLEDIEKQISEGFDKFMESEGVKTTIKKIESISDSITDYLNKPETRAKINKVKRSTLNVAEKGMDKLRVLLSTDDEDDDTLNVDDFLSEAKEKATKVVEDVKQEAKKVVEEIKEEAPNIVNDVKSTVEEAKDFLKETSTEIKDFIDDNKEEK